MNPLDANTLQEIRDADGQLGHSDFQLHTRVYHHRRLLLQHIDAMVTPQSVPIAMLLWCPQCGQRHIDEGEYASKPHHTHACQHCGMVWRPALQHTVGVQFLPGFKDEPNPPFADGPRTLLPPSLDDSPQYRDKF